MSFPFPSNPVDGQVATQALPDGTVLKATYIQAKNKWAVQRVTPKPSTLTLASDTAYIVTPGKDGQVLTFDGALNKWTPKTPANAAGGKGQTFAKGTQAATDTPNPPDPTKPTEMLQAGALQTTLENLHKELKAWDGSAWTEVLSEDTIKQWIAAGSLFRGVIKETDLATLPDVALTNRGFYWSWTGSPGYVVQKGDAKIGTDLENEVLQVGDWIQSDGTKWVHVPGDLLSKQRWDSLGSFAPWSDTSWESGSVVSYQKAFFRASALVAKGDLAPGATPANPGEVQKWVDITPLPIMSTGDLSNVNANTIHGGGIHGAVFQWDENIQEWVSSDTLEVSEVKTGTVKFGDAYGEITGVESVDLDATDPADDGTFVPSVYAVKEYVKAQPKPFLEELDDCKELAKAQDGEAPVWSSANNRWEPKAPVENMAGLSDVTLSVPSGGQVLQYKTATNSWENVTPDYLNPTNGYTKTEVDNKISTVVTGAGDLWMVGAIQQSLLSESEFKTLLPVAEQTKWVLADGRDVTGSKYAQVTGRNGLPDLRGSYLQMTGGNSNLLMWSEDFRNTADAGEVRPWIYGDPSISITPDAVIAPDGLLTGDKLACGTVTLPYQGINQYFSATTSATRFSVYAKAAELAQIELRTFNPTEWALFDLSNQTVVAISGDPAATITDAGNGWYRCSISAPDPGVTTARISLADGDNRTFTPVAGAGVYLWGAQLEEGAFTTGYIKTVDNPPNAQSGSKTFSVNMFMKIN